MPSRGDAAIVAVTSSMVSPLRIVTAPDACWATWPASAVSSRPPISSFVCVGGFPAWMLFTYFLLGRIDLRHMCRELAVGPGGSLVGGLGVGVRRKGTLS